METGYDIERIRRLTRDTAASIEQLRSVRSADPAAVTALDAVRLARRNLEDHWMPLLRSIEASEALLTWTGVGDLGPMPVGRNGPARAGRPRPIRPTAYATLTHDRLFDEFTRLANRFEFTDDPAEHPTDRALRELAIELGRRAALGTRTSDRLVELAALTPAVALLTGLAPFPAESIARILRATLLAEPHPSAGALRRHRDGVEAALGALAADPAASLDLLVDPDALATLAEPGRFDDDIVQDLVTSALYDGPVADPTRLRDGHRVLAELTRLTNDSYDSGGLADGLARGVAASFGAYVDTVAAAIRQEGRHPVLVIGDGWELELGTYDDVVDLFGALLRDPVAQAALGVTVGSYAHTLVDRLGADVTVQPGVVRLTRLADLLGDAARTEDAEMTTAAAAEEAARRRLGDAIGFGVGAVLAAGGVGTLLRSATGRAVGALAGRLTQVEPAQLPGRSIPVATYDIVTIAGLAMVLRNTAAREPLGLAGVSASTWSEISRRLDEVGSTDDPDERTRHVIRLDRWIEDHEPALTRYLAEVRAAPGMDELTEARNSVDAD